MNELFTWQSATLTQEKKINDRLKIGTVLLVVSLTVGEFRLNQAGYPTFAFGGYWGTVILTSTGLRVSTIVQQIFGLIFGLISASFIGILGILVNLSFIVLGLITLFSVLSLHKRTLKYVTIALLIAFIANFALAYFQGATFNYWFTITLSLFYIRLGDFLMFFAILIFLLESFKSKEETMAAAPVKPIPIITSTQVSRVVHCHVCPLRDVCREANVEASLRLERPLRAKYGVDPYAEMLRVTMNCPLKKNL